MVFKENDTVSLLQATEVTLVDENRSLLLPKGTQGAIVGVYGSLEQPSSYLIEFVINPLETYAIAEVRAADVIAG